MAESPRVAAWKARAAVSPGKASPLVREVGWPRAAPFVDPVVTALVVELSLAREVMRQAFRA